MNISKIPGERKSSVRKDVIIVGWSCGIRRKATARLTAKILLFVHQGNGIIRCSTHVRKKSLVSPKISHGFGDARRGINQMFSEERSHFSSHLAVRTKDRSGLQCFVLLDKFEFRARQLSTNQAAAMWRATEECTAARQQFSLLFSLVPFETKNVTKRPGSLRCKQLSSQGLLFPAVKDKVVC